MEAADYLAVGRTTMYDLVGKGALQMVKIGRCTRFRIEDLEDFIESQLTRRSQ
ncbi:MAG: helix-turn-helix domain-containing protein [Candidatus Latescibacterota bacterium]